jgi:flagellar hook assembly protein FlgD
VKWDGKNNSGVLVGDGTYTYKVRAEDLAERASNEVTGTIKTDKTAPTVNILSVSDNPFLADGSSTLTINFATSEAGKLNAILYTSTGKVTRKMFVNESRPDGIQSITWNGKSDSNTLVLAGAYVIKLTVTDAAGFTSTIAQQNLTVQR